MLRLRSQGIGPGCDGKVEEFNGLKRNLCHAMDEDIFSMQFPLMFGIGNTRMSAILEQ